MAKIGVMVCGHGSRDEDAVREFQSVADGIRARLPHYQVESGFLEFAQPIIRDGLDKLRDAGHDQVLAVPGMLFAAGLITGEALVGILMAIPIVMTNNPDVLAFSEHLRLGSTLGLAVFAAVIFALYRVAAAKSSAL